MAIHGEIGLDRGLMDASIVCAIGVALSLKWTACASQLRDPFLVGGDVPYAEGELLTRVRLSPSRAPDPAARCLLDPSNSRDGPLISISPPQISAPRAGGDFDPRGCCRDPRQSRSASRRRRDPRPRRAARVLMPRAAASLLDRALGYSYVPFADSEEDLDARRPRMTPALDALVTDADVKEFLTELERTPTEFQAAEKMAASRAESSQEVTSGLGNYRGSTLDDEVDSAGPHPGASDWTVLQRGSTGNGTTFRLLRRNGPAPGTADGPWPRPDPIQDRDGDAGRHRCSARARADERRHSITVGRVAPPRRSPRRDGGGARPGKDPPGGGDRTALWRMKAPMPPQPRDYLFVRRRRSPPTGRCTA